MKKSPEQKLLGQIDRLKAKQESDASLMSSMVWQADRISQSTVLVDRKNYDSIKAEIEKISKSFENRRRLLKRKGEKLSEIRTAELVAESLS